jgi:hypothetical protein
MGNTIEKRRNISLTKALSERSEQQKTRLAEEIVKDVVAIA